MTFSIRFKSSSEDHSFRESPNSAEGCIALGDLQESFLSPTTYWTVDDYLASWVSNLGQVRDLQNGFFATEITDPKEAALYVVWPVFWIGDSAYLTQKLLLREQYGDELHPDAIADLIDYQELVGTADQISTWALTRRDLGEALVGTSPPPGC